jgi:hypothetical protein
MCRLHRESQAVQKGFRPVLRLADTASSLPLYPFKNFCRSQPDQITVLHSLLHCSILQFLLVAGRHFIIPFSHECIYTNQNKTFKMQFFAVIILALSAVASADMSKSIFRVLPS